MGVVPLLAGLGLPGCADSAGPVDTSEPETCEPLALTLSQDLDHTALVSEEPTKYLTYTGPGVAVVDFDGDGWLDVVLAASTIPVRVLLNDGTGGLVPCGDLTVDGGALPYAHGVAAGDIDGDGLVDLALATYAGEDDLILWRTGPLTFTSEALPESTGHSTSPALGDFSGDGLIDLFMARSAEVPEPERIHKGEVTADDSSLYLQRAGDALLRGDRMATVPLPEAGRGGFTFHGAPVDIDLDGDLDLYIANDFGWEGTPNAVLLNDGTGSFTVSDCAACSAVMGAMGATIADLDGDRSPDVYVTDIGPPMLLLNDGTGELTDFTPSSGDGYIPLSPEHTTSWGVAAPDLNLDGWPDLAMAFGPINFWLPDQDTGITRYGVPIEDHAAQSDVLLRNLGEGFLPDSGGFVDESAATGFSLDDVGRAVAVGDLDRDGRPDLVTAGWVGVGEPYLRVFTAQGGCGPGITVQPEAIGATVTTTLPDRHVTTWSLPSSAFSSSAPEVYLGLGGWPEADVTLEEPGGEVQAWRGVAPGMILP